MRMVLGKGGVLSVVVAVFLRRYDAYSSALMCSNFIR